MSAHALALTLAYTGAALGVLMVVPQILRILVHPALGGVSPVAWSMTALGASMWLTYGVRSMTEPQIPGNIALVGGSVAVVLLVPSPVSRRRRGITMAAVGAAFVVLALVVPAHLVGYIAVSVGLVSAWPQVYDSVQTWRAGGRSAVSISTWSIKAVSQLCWLGYAVLSADVPVMIAATVALGTAVLLVGLESLATLGDSTSQAYREPSIARAS